MIKTQIFDEKQQTNAKKVCMYKIALFAGNSSH